VGKKRKKKRFSLVNDIPLFVSSQKNLLNASKKKGKYMAVFNSVVGRAFIMPNPEEYYPTVGDFVGRGSPDSKISGARKTLTAKAKIGSNEAVATPVAFVGNYPVMAGDRNTISWENACGDV
jgi:hypothetical protein